jgi:hypothetical protein
VFLETAIKMEKSSEGSKLIQFGSSLGIETATYTLSDGNRHFGTQLVSKYPELSLSEENLATNKRVRDL